LFLVLLCSTISFFFCCLDDFLGFPFVFLSFDVILKMLF
jgi:hypothetical protein